jgi:CDP-glucose 4,6-dehydratase
MAEVVVTGGQGFLGRHVVNRLLAEGQDVCATYNYTLPDKPSKHNLSFHKTDVTKFEECLKLINQEDPKIVVHLVAQPIVTSAVRHPFSTEELTIRGSYNILEAVRQAGKPTAIIYVSSDKVYGNNENANENSLLLGVDHPYNASKICGDVIAQMYAKHYGLPITILRSANVYGSGDFHWDRLIPGVCKNIIKNKTMIIRSDGKMLRDYVYADDLMDAYVTIIDKMLAGTLGSEIFNFGSLQSYTPIEVMNTLYEISGKEKEYQILGQAKDEIDKQHMDYSKAKTMLDWNPKTDFRDGLERTFRWYDGWFTE